MPRIVGVDIPSEQRIEIALTAIYGVGRNNVGKILQQAGVDPDKRAGKLSDEEVSRINKTLENYKIGGDLKKEVSESIKRLEEIGSYRGLRHARGLPVRGQRTRTNARTKRGKRVTIGALKKEVMAKVEQAKRVKEREEKKTAT